MKHADTHHKAEIAFRHGKTRDVLALAETLIASDHVPANGAGYLMRGIAYEIGGDGIDIDLPRAEANFRKACTLSPDAISYLYLARVLMKQGGDKYRSALRWIDDAKATRMVPDVHLAYAAFYEGGGIPDLARARRHYRRAMATGRFAGFFGYARLSRKMGQKGRALLVDVIRIATGPIIYLLVGSEASKTF